MSLTTTETKSVGTQYSLDDDYMPLCGPASWKLENNITRDSSSESDDSLNDEFRPMGEGVATYEIFIFNSWGELIFTSKNFNQYWDGSISDGKIAPNGQYSYVINVLDDMQVAHTFKGNLLLQK